MATPHPLADRAAATDNNTVAALYTKPENLQVTNLMHKSINSNSAGSAELTAVVDDLLNQLHTKFTTVSSELLSKSVIFPLLLYI